MTTASVKTERVVVQLGKLHPNPFKKHILGGKLNEERVARLEESIGQSGFWDGFAARKNGNGYQLAFGHHRLQAAINQLGKEYRTSILVADYDDDQMARMMINENSTAEGGSIVEQSDSVVFAQQYLKAHPKACKYPIHGESGIKGAAKKHKHGSERCIVAYLGEAIWSQPKVHRILEQAGLEDKTIIEDRNKKGSSTPSRGRVGHGTAGKLGKLAKPMQQAFVKAIKQAKVGLPADLVNEAIDTAVEHVGKDASKEEQEKAAVAAIKAAEAQELKDIALRRSKMSVTGCKSSSMA